MRFPRIPRQARWIVAAAAVIIVLIPVPAAAEGAGSAAPAADLATPAGASIDRLTSDNPAAAWQSLPSDFTARLHYYPQAVTISGRHTPANPRGGCSSPVPLPHRFEPLCQVHDLGYDLLRYASDTGKPLGDWARRRLDAWLVDHMRADCSNPLCAAGAELAGLGLAVNTWRQPGAPHAESATGILLSVVTGEQR